MTPTSVAHSRSIRSRILIALGLSLLAHAVLLLGPSIELPRAEPPLPPLMAKLEPLPKPAAKPPRRAPPPERMPVPATPVPIATEAETAPPDAFPAETAAEPSAAASPSNIPDAAAPPKLPRHAVLIYSAYLGKSLKVGEMRHRFDIDEQGHYTLDISAKTTGVASLFKSLDSSQHSEGLLTSTGLRPELFRERKNISGSLQEVEARFDWVENKLQLGNGSRVNLHDGAQDLASFLYQLSQLPQTGATLPIYISNGRKLEHYELEIGTEEIVQTDIGRLRTLPLRKVHAPGEEGLDIWLALEYRLLPVKIRQIERDGHQAGEILISEIRVSDE